MLTKAPRKGHVRAGTMQSYRNSPSLTVSVAGPDYAYPELGVVNGLATDRHVIALGYRGVGDSTGQVSDSIEVMAADVVDVIGALGYNRVDVVAMTRRTVVTAMHAVVSFKGPKMCAPGLRPRRRFPKPPRVRRCRPGFPPPVAVAYADLTKQIQQEGTSRHESVRYQRVQGTAAGNGRP